MTTTQTSECPMTKLGLRQPPGAEGGPGASLAARLAVLAYGVFAYAMFFVTILYAIGFVGGWVVPKTINSGAAGALWPSLLINGLLLTLFVVQHTIMARPAFKRWWTRFVPASIERSTFVIAASALLLLVFWQWRPLPEVVWHVEAAWARWGLIGLSLAGWAIVFLSSFMVSHFDLFGLRQVYFKYRNQEYQPLQFRIVGLYKLVRHPLMVGFLIAFWATPTMTVGHLCFAIMTTAYIFFGTAIEERDLVAHFGEKYLEYRRQVRGLVPVPRRRV